ncbi:2424_t:CDS:2, partial [Acaulospora morrowiae]
EGETMRSSDGGLLDTIIDAGSVKGRSCGHLTVVFSAHFLVIIYNVIHTFVRSSDDERCWKLSIMLSTCSCDHLTTDDVGSEGKTMRSSDGSLLATIIDAGSHIWRLSIMLSTRSCGHLTTNDVGSEGKTMRSSDGGLLDTIIDVGSVKGRLCGHLTVVFSPQSSMLEVEGETMRSSDGGLLDTIIDAGSVKRRLCGHLTVVFSAHLLEIIYNIFYTFVRSSDDG